MKQAKKIAVVTGVSHPNGIGAAICKQLAEKDIDIFFTHWEAKSHFPIDFQKEIRAYGVRCEQMELDLSTKEAPFVLLDTVAEQLENPTILINNAAYSTNDSFEKLNADTIDRHYEVNMRATFLLCVEFAKRITKGVPGRIINMTSGQDLGPMIHELAYSATKGAITAFTRSLSAEVASLGITVNAVNPGPTDTGWMTEEIKEELAPKFLTGRIGLPNDAARLVAFLVSEEAEWITGQVIHSEGGFLRR